MFVWGYGKMWGGNSSALSGTQTNKGGWHVFRVLVFYREMEEV
jgi:hypothetical protein